MRELKFRAFDTENKTWTFVTLGDLICGACMKNGDKPLSGAEQVWEQYTGLKDKNGKEIYEGDIVGYAYTGCNYKVVYRRYDASFVLENDDREETIQLHYDRQSNYEVAGNVHENPELLGEE